MEIRQIQYFLSIVDTGSFSAAADEHYISQSSLSKMIIALEKELAVALFDRSKRRVSLTEAGEAFLRHARQLNAGYKAMLVELDGYKSDVDSFSIAAIPVLPQYGIATLISQFRDRYPHIHFSLEEIDGLNIIPALTELRFDLAFTRHNYLDQDQFASVEISKDKLLLVVSKNNRHATRSYISLKELANDNFIMFDRVTDLHKLIMDECGKAGFEPTIFYSSHRKVSVLGLVQTNIGIALMPVKTYEYHRHPDVLGIPLDEYIECNLVLVYLKNRQLPKAVMTFVDFMKHAAENGKP
jgi:LysR family transcriptional regulator, transcription activator of glutamate synthase operon